MNHSAKRRGRRPMTRVKTFSTVILMAALAVGAAGCGSSGGDAAPKSTAPSADGKTASTTSSEPANTTATAPAPVKSAAPDASPFVTGFGNLAAIKLPDGDPSEVSIVATNSKTGMSDSILVIVRNNTSEPVGEITVTGTARDASGALAGSGSSQGFDPAVVAPGEIALGYVYFDGGYPADGKFEYDVSADEVGDYFQPMTVTEINNTGDAVVGAVSNDTGVDVTGPISANVWCFDDGGAIISSRQEFTEQDELAKDAKGSFSADLYGEPCPIGLAAASGYGN